MGIMPSEFWAMTADEFLTLVEYEQDGAPIRSGGKLTRQDAHRMVRDLDLSDADWWAKNGTPKN